MVELVWEPSGVVRRLAGQVSAAQLDESAKCLQGDPRLDDLRYIIHDFSAATNAVVSQDEIEFMAVRASVALQRNARVRIAFVGDHSVVHGLTAAFNDLGLSNHRCRRFSTLEEARAYACG